MLADERAQLHKIATVWRRILLAGLNLSLVPIRQGMTLNNSLHISFLNRRDPGYQAGSERSSMEAAGGSAPAVGLAVALGVGIPAVPSSTLGPAAQPWTSHRVWFADVVWGLIWGKKQGGKQEGNFQPQGTLEHLIGRGRLNSLRHGSACNACQPASAAAR